MVAVPLVVAEPVVKVMSVEGVADDATGVIIGTRMLKETASQ